MALDALSHLARYRNQSELFRGRLLACGLLDPGLPATQRLWPSTAKLSAELGLPDIWAGLPAGSIRANAEATRGAVEQAAAALQQGAPAALVVQMRDTARAGFKLLLELEFDARCGRQLPRWLPRLKWASKGRAL